MGGNHGFAVRQAPAKTTFFAILNSPFNLTQSSAFAENLFLSL